MGKMKSSLALCLWICFTVYVSTSNGCSEIPVVENAEVAESARKTQYSQGDTLEYNCRPGYASLIKIIYKCNNDTWGKWRGEKCSLKRCESPQDLPNGRYIVKSGRGFVFGTVIQYICNEGYQMMSRFDTRTCRDGGWDNQLPACDEISCERKEAEGNLRVEGLPDNPEDLIRYGHRLTFSCEGLGLSLHGKKVITCQLNGEWSDPFPKCVAKDVICKEEPLINVAILIGHPVIAPPYNPGHVLVFDCTDEKMEMQGHRAIECLSSGKWDHPYPKCKETPCKDEKTIDVEILTQHPRTASQYKPGHVLVFQCTDENKKIQGQRAIKCLSNGEWDHPYPQCEEIRCEIPHNQNVFKPSDNFFGDMKLGSKQIYSCEAGYEKMAEEATCTRDGWTPKPLCAKNTCEIPRGQHVNRPYEYFSEELKRGSKHIYSCESGYEKMAEEATCTRDGWTPNPLCAKSKCEVPLGQHVFRPSDYFRGEMKFEARRSYHCESGYEKMAEEATCTRDGWTPNPLCANIRCKVPLDQHVLSPSDYFREEMKIAGRKTYYCEAGFVKMAQQAVCTRDGWTPNPLCADIRCKEPLDQHVLSPSDYFREEMKTGGRKTYLCEAGFVKMAEQAVCTRDGWTPNPLCAVMTGSRRCGSPPKVNNADTVQMTKNEYSTGERVEYSCFNKYTLDQQHPYTRSLTCQQGQWTGIIKCLKPCTVTKEIMDERGIDLAYSNQQKVFAEHNDHITFDCLPGKSSLGIKFRQKCNDGEIILPLCV
ncbi:complement factor H like 4 isoform X2 [Puntigrus tetrazona]|uniref:complement factor H like 4 isoform X2 n=1 Tax=Puntigrus tetrazona TaxID=1606681 RepID=UPI001C899DED|nr:complement factor H like 4 isoform X2 [Puntigrus tetrazona]